MHRQIFLRIIQLDKFSNNGTKHSHSQQNLHSSHTDDFLVVILQPNYVFKFARVCCCKYAVC